MTATSPSKDENRPRSWVKATVTKPVSFRVQRLRELLRPPFDEVRVIGIFPIMVSLSNHALPVTERLYFLRKELA